MYKSLKLLVTVRFCSFTLKNKKKMEILEAQKELWELLKWSPNVVGIDNDDKVITVLIKERTSKSEPISVEYQGYKIIIEVSGPIELQQKLTF